MRSYAFTFTAVTLTCLLGRTALGAGTEQLPPKAAAAPATKPSGASDMAQAIDTFVLRRVDAQVVLDQADAQKKALDFIGAGKAHYDAVINLQQCQNCHQNGQGVVKIYDPHGLRVSVTAPDTPWVGISVGPADDVLRSQLKLPEGTGVVVTKVVPDGPANKADVREHDILVSVNGQPVADGDALDVIVKAAKPDAPPLALKLLREGQPAEKQVAPSREAHQWLSLLSGVANPRSPFRIGVSVSEPDETLRLQLRLADSGLVVTAVADDSPAAKQGVKVNDVLLSANGRTMKGAGDLPEVVRQAAESPVELELLRGGVRLKIGVTPEKDPSAAVDQFLSAQINGFQDQQELTLLEPGLISRATLDLARATHTTARPQTQPASSPSQRLDEIVSQLDQLRSAVEALRADVAKETPPAATQK